VIVGESTKMTWKNSIAAKGKAIGKKVCVKCCQRGVFTNTHQCQFVMAGQVLKPTAVTLCTGDGSPCCPVTI